MISIEAEHYVSIGSTEKHSWTLATNSIGYSGDGIMISSPDIGANTDFGDGSVLNYEIVFLQAGIYFVWIRDYGIGSGDTCHVGLNGQEISTGNTIDFPRGEWTWVNENRNEQTITFSIEKSGLYIFNIFMREDGMAVDKILLTRNSDFHPTGVGPAFHKVGRCNLF